MRILVTTTRGAGHIGPLLPFARALLRANHDVLFAVVAPGAPLVESAGFDVWPLPAAPEEVRNAMFSRVSGLSREEADVLVVRDLFAGLDARTALPGVQAVIASWQPDVVLYDSVELAAPLAAEAAGVPAVRMAVMGGAAEAFVIETAAPVIDELRTGLGLLADRRADRLRGLPAFTLMPAALEDPEAPGFGHEHRFREEPAGAPRPVPDHWEGDESPLVYMTFGSSVPQNGFYPDFYRAAIDAVAGLPARVLVTIGKHADPAALGELPANVHVAGWIPQADILEHAAVMVCHGGSGTVTGGLAAGVPMAVLPLFADMHHNAERVDAVGAGIAIEGPHEITAAVQNLLAEPSYRDTARRIAAEIAEVLPVDAAVNVLEELVAYSQPCSVAWSTA